MSATTGLGYIGNQTAVDYIKSHREQTPEVAAAVRGCLDDILVYSRDALAGEPGTDCREAYHLLDTVSTGLAELRQVPLDQLAENKQKADAWAKATTAAGQGTLNGQPVEMREAGEEKAEGLMKPNGQEVEVTLPSRQTKEETVTSRVLSSTLHVGPEHVALDDHNYSYDPTYRLSYNRAEDPLRQGRGGLKGLMDQADDLVPLLQAALSNKALMYEYVAKYHSESQSEVSGSSSSDLESVQKMFHRGRTDATSSAEFSGSSSSSTDATVETTGVDAFRQIQTLRKLVACMQSMPAMRVTVQGAQPMTVQAQVETTTTHPKHFLQGQAAPQVQVTSQNGWFSNTGKPEQDKRRELGTMDWAPAYIDVRQPE